MKPTRTIQSWLAAMCPQPSISARYVAAGLALSGAPALSAANIQWVGSTGSYNVPANWETNTVPNAFDNAFVNNGGTVQVLPSDPTWWVIDLRAAEGADSSGTYEVSGSRVNLVEWLRIGVNGTGTFNMTDGFFNMLNRTAGRINVGETGNGTLNLSGGIIDQKGGLTTFGERGGENVSGLGTLNMTGGLFNSAGEVWFGQGGASTEAFGIGNIEDGTFTAGSWLSIGRAGGVGELNISGGVLNKSSNGGNFLLGDRAGADNSNGTINQSGGTVNVGTEFWIGEGGRLVGTDPETNEPIRNSSTGIYNLSAGELNLNTWSVVGRNGANGTLNLTGGIINKIGANQFIVGAGVGADDTQSTGVVNHSGGTLNVAQGELWIGENASARGTYNLSGLGQLNVGTISLGQNGTPTSILNLNGGTLRVAQILRRATEANATGTLNLNGTQIIATASRPDFITGLTALNIQNGGLRIDSNGYHVGTSQDFTFVGTGGLTKTGLGTFTVGADGSFPSQGPIVVNGGVLEAIGSIGGASVTVGPAGTVTGSGNLLGSSTFQEGSTLLGNTVNTTPLRLIGNVSVAGPTWVDVADTSAFAGTYTLATYTGTLTGAANFRLARPGTVTASGGNIIATIQDARDITWTASQNSTWDIFTTANWTAGATATAFGQSDAVTFTDAAGSAPVSIVGSVRPDTIDVENSAGNTITFTPGANGAIVGAPFITKDGAGKWIVGTENPLTSLAGVDLLAGELQIGNGGGTGSFGAANIFADAGTTLSLNHNSAKILRSPISGEGSLVKNGSATTALEGSTTFTGSTTINAGRLTFRSPAAPASSTITNNSELEIDHTGAGPLNIGAAISGTGKFLKSGGSEVTLTAANTFSGDVEILRGPNNSLNITHGQALGTTSGKTIVNGANGNTGQHLNVRLLSAGGTTIAEPLEFRATAAGRAGIRHEGEGQTLNLTGPITANSTGLGGVHLWNHLGNSTLNISGDISGTMNGGALFLRGSTGPINVTGGINLDFAELIITDSARITLGGAGKTYTGFRTNIAFGHLRTLVDNALDPTQPVNLGQNNTGQEARLILGSGSTPVQQTLAAITIDNPAPTSGIFGGASTPSTLTLNMNRNTAIPAQIGGGGVNENNLNLVKTGPGILTLSAAVNSFTGTTTVNGGRLIVNGNNSSSPVTINAGGRVGGTGTIGSVVASGSSAASATLAPADDGIGILTAFGTVNLGGNSALNAQIANWTGVAGTGSDLLNVGNLSITSTAAAPTRINVSGLNLQNFENADRSFTIVQASGSITGFEASKFVVDSTGIPDATGTWTVRQSGNAIVLDYTASTGGGGSFADWAAARGLTGPAAEPTADPDNDGIANAVEFVIGGEPNPANPGSNSNALLPTIATTPGGDVAFTFRLTADAEALGEDAVFVEYSTNIVTWLPATDAAGVTVTSTPAPGEPAVNLVTVTLPAALADDDGRLFARLAVQLP